MSSEDTKTIPYGRQNISDEDVGAVVDILKSDWLTQGPAVEQFEKAVATYCGARYAVAVNSATSALHIACLAAKLGPDGCLWTSPNTFVASANCALYCGGGVDFVDIDPRTYNLDVDELARKLEDARHLNRLPQVVIPVHFAGMSCQMDRIAELAEKYRFTVIEDASHAIGGRFAGGAVGSCRFSAMTVFSFHPVKIITTGEGGMVLTNDRSLYDRLIRLRSHGITRDDSQMADVSHGPWYYQQVELGFNYRLTDFQAALGLSQLRRLDAFVSRRHVLANRYNEALKDLPLVLPWQHPDAYSAFHLYVVRLKLDKISSTRREIFESMRRLGILVNVHYIPVHTQPYYRELGFSSGDFPESEHYYRETLSLPLYADLSESDQDRVIAAVRELVR